MSDYSRFCIYAVPTDALYDRGAEWLGWDSAAGVARTPPDLPGLPAPADALTERPRRYGFHGTIKPPFRLAEGCDADGLRAAMDAFCAGRAPVVLPGLEVARLGSFVALRPEGEIGALAEIAAAAVRALDPFRAPLTESERARRQGADLTERQEELLAAWGYPYVMEEFRFHLTLTGPLDAAGAETTQQVLAGHFADVLPRPFVLRDLALLGEDADGRFHLLHRAALSG